MAAETQLVTEGNTVSVHYTGRLEDGTEFDSSRSRGDTLSFTVGGTQVIAGFGNAVLGMEVGETRNVSIPPEDGYGHPTDEAITAMPRTVFPEGFELVKGASVQGTNGLGQPVIAKIVEYSETEVTLDMNHPLAGKVLNFEIELVSID